MDELGDAYWLTQFSRYIGSSKLIVKRRPRDLGASFPRVDCIDVLDVDPSDGTPAELITIQCPFKYIGFYTTLILSFSALTAL